MDYSQQPLLDIFKTGKVFNEDTPPKHLESVLSNVFIFGKIVYKVYKNYNAFFNKEFRDISGKEARFDFTKKDFEWNKLLSPDIYTKIVGVKVIDNKIAEVPEDQAEELLFVMKRIDDGDILFEQLIKGVITEEDCFEIGRQLAELLKKVQKPFSQPYDLYEMLGWRIKDTRTWIQTVSDDISFKEASLYCDYMDHFREKNKEWLQAHNNSIVTDGDIHCHNTLYKDGTLQLIDTFPPKEQWLIGHSYIGIFRMATDIYALTGNKSFFDACIQGYEEGSRNNIDPKWKDYFVIYASVIAVSYLYMLQKTDPSKKVVAEKFHSFLKEYFKNIKGK